MHIANNLGWSESLPAAKTTWISDEEAKVWEEPAFIESSSTRPREARTSHLASFWTGGKGGSVQQGKLSAEPDILLSYMQK